MCKGCDMTREIERLFRDNGMMSGDGFANFANADDFSAAINAMLNVLAHIAASMPDRRTRRAFMVDVVKQFESNTKERVAGVHVVH